MWAMRLQISEDARKEHRMNAGVLVKENETLQTKIQQMERDAIEVVQHLKKEITSAQRDARQAMDQLKEVS